MFINAKKNLSYSTIKYNFSLQFFLYIYIYNFNIKYVVSNIILKLNDSIIINCF